MCRPKPNFRVEIFHWSAGGHIFTHIASVQISYFSLFIPSPRVFFWTSVCVNSFITQWQDVSTDLSHNLVVNIAHHTVFCHRGVSQGTHHSDLHRYSLLNVKPIHLFGVWCLFENAQCACSTKHRRITRDMPLGAEVSTLISEVKMRQPSIDLGGASNPAFSSKPCLEKWLPDMLILRMTFPVQFVVIFSVSQWSSLAGTDSAKPVWKTAGRLRAAGIHITVLFAGAVPPWIKSWLALRWRRPVNPSRWTRARMTQRLVRSMEKSSHCSVWRTWSQSVVYVGKEPHTSGTGSIPLVKVLMTVR